MDSTPRRLDPDSFDRLVSIILVCLLLFVAAGCLYAFGTWLLRDADLSLGSAVTGAGIVIACAVAGLAIRRIVQRRRGI